MTGSRYAVDVDQLVYHGAFHLDAHTFFMQNMKEEQPDFIAEIITQISTKAVFKYWRNKYHNVVHYNMKQRHFMDNKKTSWKNYRTLR